MAELTQLPGAATPAGSQALEIIGTQRLLPVIVLEDAEDARKLGPALKAAGSTCAEVTFRTAAAADALRILAEDPEVVAGAGTVVRPEQVDVAVEAGARYIVTPGFSPAVVRACQAVGVPVIPGIASATELQMALDAGLELVKLFPAEIVGGLRLIQALSAPYPMTRFIPTGGVSAANLDAYLAHPAVFAVGGTWIVAPELIRDGNYEEVTRRTADALRSVADAAAGTEVQESQG